MLNRVYKTRVAEKTFRKTFSYMCILAEFDKKSNGKKW